VSTTPLRATAGDLTVDAGARTVSRAGETLRLGKLTFDFLTALIELAPNVASFDDLMQRVWSGLAVSPETISQRASMLRRALTGPGAERRYFEAVRGLGFRLVVDVERQPHAANLGLRFPKAVQTIAVMPFVTHGDADQEFFSDGLVEGIINDLLHIPQILVISRNSTFHYKGKNAAISEIAERFNVNFVLQGSVRRSADRVRVSTQLVSASSEQTVWSEKYDRFVSEIFGVQDDVTREIVTALEVEIGSGEQARHRRSQYSSPQSGEMMYRGMHHFYKFDRADNVMARRCFEEFIRREPQSTIGYVWLVMAWAFALIVRWEEPAVALRQLKENVDKALSLDGEDPQALVGDVYYRVLSGDVEGGVRSGQRATEVAPNLDDAWFAFGWAQMVIGETEKSIVCLTRAVRLSPILTSMRLGVLGTAYRNAGRYDESIQTFQACIDSFPDWVYAHTGLAVSYGLKGDHGAAAEKVNDILRLDPTYTVNRFIQPDLYRDKSVMKACAAVLRRAGLRDG
jgi:adenylate cyclase